MPKRPPKHWFKRCVKAVKTRGPRVTNPNKICGNNWHNRMSMKAKKKALREEKKLAKHDRDGVVTAAGLSTSTQLYKGVKITRIGSMWYVSTPDYPEGQFHFTLASAKKTVSAMKSDGLLDQISDFFSKVTGRTRARKKRVVTSVKVCKKIYLAKDHASIKPSKAKRINKIYEVYSMDTHKSIMMTEREAIRTFGRVEWKEIKAGYASNLVVSEAMKNAAKSHGSVRAKKNEASVLYIHDPVTGEWVKKKGRYRLVRFTPGKNTKIVYYRSSEEAHAAYNAAAKRFHAWPAKANVQLQEMKKEGLSPGWIIIRKIQWDK